MMKITLKVFLGLLLAASLALNVALFLDVALSRSLYEQPEWKEEDIVVLNHLYSELAKIDEAPIRSFPWKIKKSKTGYTILFKDNDHIFSNDSFFFGGNRIVDGCSIYELSDNFELVGLHHCG